MRTTLSISFHKRLIISMKWAITQNRRTFIHFKARSRKNAIKNLTEGMGGRKYGVVIWIRILGENFIVFLLSIEARMAVIIILDKNIFVVTGEELNFTGRDYSWRNQLGWGCKLLLTVCEKIRLRMDVERGGTEEKLNNAGITCKHNKNDN